MGCMVEEGHIVSNVLRTALISLKSSSDPFNYNLSQFLWEVQVVRWLGSHRNQVFQFQ